MSGVKPRVVCYGPETDDPFLGESTDALNLLRQHFDVVYLRECEADSRLLATIQGIVTSVRLYRRLSPLIRKMPALKVITTWSAGFEHLRGDLEYLKERGIKVGCIPLTVTRATADFTFALLMASARDILPGVEEAISPSRNVERGFVMNPTPGADVAGSTMGIVGMGRIGFQVARRAQGFDMKVLYHNRKRRSLEDEALVGATYFSDVHQMAPLCDFLVICCPLTEETRHLVNAKLLSVMRPTATLVNTARGAVVDTDALVEALNAGRLRGAALDVTDPEPLPLGHPLIGAPGALITSHRGSCDAGCRRDMWREMCNNLKAVLIDNTDLPPHNKLC